MTGNRTASEGRNPSSFEIDDSSSSEVLALFFLLGGAADGGLERDACAPVTMGKRADARRWEYVGRKGLMRDGSSVRRDMRRAAWLESRVAIVDDGDLDVERVVLPPDMINSEARASMFSS